MKFTHSTLKKNLFLGAYLVVNKLKNNYTNYKVDNPHISFNTWFKNYGYNDIKYQANDNYSNLKQNIINFSNKKICKKTNKNINLKDI